MARVTLSERGMRDGLDLGLEGARNFSLPGDLQATTVLSAMLEAFLPFAFLSLIQEKRRAGGKQGGCRASPGRCLTVSC